MNIEKVDIKKIVMNPNNPRIIKDDKFKKLVKSIKDFPEMLEVRPIVVDDNMVVLGGNMRLKACISAGLTEVPIIKFNNLTEEKKKEFIVKDNVGYGEWDFELLKSEWDTNLLTDWGLDVSKMNNNDNITDDEYNEPDNLQNIDVVLGDLFEIGNHRLLCGDSTNLEDIDKLLNGNKIDILFTDPPYNVSFNGRSGKFDIIKNDNLGEDEFINFINEFANCVHTLGITTKYIWCNWKFYGVLQNNFNFNSCIVWAKNVFGLGRGYRHQHEFCLFEGKLDDGINNETDLWEIKKDTNYLHPTQKPIDLACRALNNHRNTKNVLDLFAGSGSTIVASHKLSKNCFAMELDPKYCQIIIDRMLKLEPSIKIKKNGKEYKN